MTQEMAVSKPESPARRLGILYTASFCMIGVLTALSQAFVLRELSWQTGAIHAVGQRARQRSLDPPLSLHALAVLAAGESSERLEAEGSLRRAILRSRRDLPGSPRPIGGHSASFGPEPKTLMEAGKHRLAATRSAEALLERLDLRNATLPRFVETGPLVRTLIEEEVAYFRAVDEATRPQEAEAVVRIKRLESFEFKLIGLVLVVLLLEGLYVVRPAVQKIQVFVDEMSRSNEAMKVYAGKLERSNRELQDFASVASHDLQEPLRKVQAFSDRLRSKCAGSIDAQGHDYLERIQHAAGRMQTLINDLLTYARVATKAQPFVPTNLVTITHEVVSDLEARIEQVAGRVEVGEMPSVDADPLQIRQLMQNLIGNSLKYKRPDVPPVVKVSGRHLPHDPSSPAGGLSGPVCQILVEDNGIGFDEIYTDRIFTIFQRLHGRNDYEGTGVGLAVCRKIVERHGGLITARSTPGNGSTFIVTLPVRHPKEAIHNGREP